MLGKNCFNIYMVAWFTRRYKMVRLYHRYYKRSGLYKFIFKNFLRIVTVVLILILVFAVIEQYIVDFDEDFKSYIKGIHWHKVLLIFFLSETFFGLIPPDFFILWANQFEKHFLVLSYLGGISYIGGLLAFIIGRQIRKIRNINAFMIKRFKAHYNTIKKWGGVLIIIAALFPLPYSTISLIAGMMRFPPNLFLLYGVTRILRFYIYGLFIIQFFK